jgi:hypothetical protein
MPAITEYDVRCRAVKKLEKVRMRLSCRFAWNEWVRRIKSHQVKESVAVRLREIHVSAIYWEVWKKHMVRPVRIRQLHSTVICWEVWKERMERSKAFDEFYAEWQHRKEPNIIIC